MSSASCIYCSAPAASEEHYLPRCLGAFGYELLRDRLCVDCNGFCGRVLDQELIRNGPEGVVRAAMGISGRHDDSPNPAYYRAATTQPVRLTIPQGRDPHLFYEVSNVDGVPRGRPATQIVVASAADDLQAVVVNPNWKVEHLQHALEFRNVTGWALRDIHADPADLDAILGLLRPIFPGFEAQHYARDGERTQETTRGEFRLTREYFRGVAKIAFHYALAFLPVRGDEAEFGLIRDFVRQGIGEPTYFVHDVTTLGPQPKVPFSGHIMKVRSDERGTIGHVSLFVAPEHQPLVWAVVLATRQTTRRAEQRAHAAVYLELEPGQGDGRLFDVTGNRGDDDCRDPAGRLTASPPERFCAGTRAPVRSGE